MKTVLLACWQVMLFRARPEDIPYYPKLILPLLLLNVSVSLGIQQVLNAGTEQPTLPLTLISLAIEGVWLYLLLSRFSWQMRWVQAFTGLIFVDTAITLMVSPLALLAGTAQSLVPLVMVAQLVLAFWSLWARGYIYQHTLELGRLRGLLLAFVPLIIVMIVVLQFFPEILPVAAKGS